MNTKLVMSLSALIMGGTGIALTFMPQEVSVWFGWESSASAVPFQLLGALYFGFAMTNWTARANLIGGIYGRPIAITFGLIFFTHPIRDGE